MEHDVYICKWKKTSNGYRLWVKGKPNVSVEGSADITELSNRLCERIIETGGAYQAVLEFDKSFPKSAFDARYSKPEIYAVLGDERFEIECHEQGDTRFDQYFARPHCPDCGSQTSTRTQDLFNADYIRTSYDGGFLSIRLATIAVFSDQFLSLLSEEEKQSLEFQPLKYAKKSKRQYFELTGPAGPPLTAISTLEAVGWRCDSCGIKSFGYWSPKSSIGRFVTYSELPKPLPSVFTIGSGPEILLCMTAARWGQLRGKPGTKGIVSKQIGVAPDSDVVRTPELPTLQEQEEKNRERRRRERQNR